MFIKIWATQLLKFKLNGATIYRIWFDQMFAYHYRFSFR